MTLTDTSTLPPKTRVVATQRLPGVPEGTGGRLGRAVGLTLTRYRVAFDNGVDLTSVTHTKVVREDDWDEFREQREAQREAAESEEPTPSTDGPDAGDGSEAPASSPADDRLAALLAKSKAAKQRKQAGG